MVDHIHSNKLNNDISNLQILSNRQNLSRERTTKSGFPVGVQKIRNRYRSIITIDYKRIHLSCFNTPEEASKAYQTKLSTLK